MDRRTDPDPLRPPGGAETDRDHGRAVRGSSRKRHATGQGRGAGPGKHLREVVVLKTSNESAFGVDRFNSTDTTSGHYLPVVSVDYGSPVGNPSTSTYLTQQLTRHSTAGVNPATGNLLVRTTDLSVHGTGLDLAYEHDYNSLLARDLHAPAVPRSPMGGELGHGWTGSLGDDVWLDRSELKPGHRCR